MKKQSWILGLVISLGISLIATSPRLIRMERVDVSFITFNALYNFIFSISCWVVYQYLFHTIKLQQSRKQRFWVATLSIFAVASLSFLCDRIFSLFTNNMLQFPEITGNRRFYMLLFRGLLISGLYYFIFYYLHVLAEKQKASLEVEQLKRAQLAASLSSLKEQLSPHFLFNTLNTLSTLTEEKSVKDYVAELANVYRYVLQYKKVDVATLQEELTFILSYLYIIKTRFEHAIAVDIHVDKNLMQAKIPPLTLQLLIENAIKHNIASGTRQLRIEIKNEANGYLIICNNLQPKSSVSFSTGTGLGNVMQRYQLLFGKAIIIEKTDISFIVKLPIA